MSQPGIQPNAPPRRAPVPGPRRPLQRAREWTARRVKLKKPSKKAMYWMGGVIAVIALAIAILIAIWDWNWFRGPISRIASARMHREVTIAGDLNVHLWSWQPSATVDRILIANPAWARGQTADSQRMAEIERLAIRIRLLPLLIGHVDLRLLRFDRPNVRLQRDAQGRANWDFSDGKTPDAPMKLPPIHRFVINEGQLAYNDVQRKLAFSGVINAREVTGAQNRGFELTGKGALNRQPFLMAVTGGPLLNIERNKPYPFDADIRAGETRITAEGSVLKPFDLGQLAMNLTARGPDMNDLYGLTGIALPNTPPYNLHGRFTRDEDLFKITGLGGTVGDSDLNGDLSVQVGLKRPLLTADLNSRSLDFDDLGALFGGAPSTKPGEAASTGQKAVAQKLTAEQRLFPDSTLQVDRIRTLDADVTYKALSIRDAPIHLRAGSTRVKLDNGLLRADPLKLDLPQGQVAGFVQLNARGKTPVTALDLRLSNARLEQLIPIKADGPLPLVGSIVGRAQLTGTGDSVHKAFASANGKVVVVVPNGEIREAFAQLLGVNVVKGLGLLLSKDQQKTDVRCAVAQFDTRNGVMNAQRIVFDTDPVLGQGSGSIDLGRERMDFRIQGKPKKAQLLRVLLPVTVQGPIRGPHIGVEPGKAIAQGGLALALGSVLSPLAAILPFVDPGLAKDANCQALVADASQQGAPTKTAAPTKAR
jgi:uncharacterized protein involved in outer membrane biogenesis